MPTIQLDLNEQDHARLDDEYRKAMLALLQNDPAAVTVSFEQWLMQRLRSSSTPVREQELQAVRAYGAVEKFVFALHQHGFGLVDLRKSHIQQFDQAMQELAEAIAGDLELQTQYVKRVYELLGHFVKSAKDAANEANIGVTAKTRLALSDAYRMLMVRTEKALDTLGNERAIGRVEGAASVLVSADIMDRGTAKAQTDSFKIRVRTATR